MFCPKCGSIMVPKKEKEKSFLACTGCGFVNKSKEKIELKETIKKKSPDIEIASEDEETLPITDSECPKCKNSKAYYWLVQTRAGDEPETKFLKCTKCKHTWRDYS